MPDEPILRVIPFELKRRRLEATWDQGDLSRESGVSKATISEIERGEAGNTRPGIVRKLATALKCEPSEISEVVVGAEPAGAAS